MSAAKIEILEKFRIGHDVIDRGHRMCLDMINDINDAIKNGQFRACRELFGSFIEVAENHFRKEEQILREADFPGLAGHTKYHHDLLRKARKVKGMCGDTADRKHLQGIFDEMSSFLIDDVVRGDLEFKSFLIDKGLARDLGRESPP